MFEYYLYYPNYKLRGYEEVLAQKEVIATTGEIPEQIDGGLRIISQTSLNTDTLQRLTFFHRIEVYNSSSQWSGLTYQTLLENTAKIARKVEHPNQVLSILNQITRPMNGRKESQHITHGIHDYKGKFYPQLVKSLLNYLGSQQDDVILDPFMGSGTTIVESYLANMIGVGVDLNPLAHLISKAKMSCLSLQPEVVIEESGSLLQRIDEEGSSIIGQTPQDGLWAESVQTTQAPVQDDELMNLCREITTLPYTAEELKYLFSWFSPLTLLKLFLILREIERVADERLKILFRVLLSDIIRDCSQQDPHDLRIRRRRVPLRNAPVFELFRERVLETSKQLVAFLSTSKTCGVRSMDWECHYGDTRDLSVLPSRYLAYDNSVDLAITSPPYATALPYLDTDRLSLAFLRLANPHQRRRLEDEMIGNREIVPGVRRKLEQAFLDHYDENPLPMEVKECIRNIYECNAAANVGFRRKNMGALLYKYFDDMRRSMAEVQRVLKPGARFALIVGNNVTKAGDKQVEILTDRYLGLIGESLGMRLVEELHITVTTEDLAHVKNSIKDNTLLILEKCSV
jgi:DNA modification methylase